MSKSPPQNQDAVPSNAHSSFHEIETEGFPWTGLTLVLVVLGLIAFMAVPSGPVSPKARAAAVLETSATQALAEFRAGIRDYYLDHRHFPGDSPRASARDEAGARWLDRQLSLYTDDAGNPAGGPTPEHVYGPYLADGIPSNPLNGLSSVKLVDSAEGVVPDNSTGWIFFREEGLVRLNSPSRLRSSTERYFDL